MIAMLLILFSQAEPKAKATPADVSPRTKAILAKLDEPIRLDFNDETSLDDVLRYIKRATAKGPNDPGLPIYVDSLGLWEAEAGLKSTVTIKVKGWPLKRSLRNLLAQVRMDYCVKDEMLFISSLQGIIREQQRVAEVPALDDSPKTKALLARLEQPIAMPFENATPLSDVLQHIKTAARKSPDDPEIPILVVPGGLEEIERSLNSTVQIGLENVPLKATLRLLLKQLGMAYGVRDGHIVIHSERGIRKMMRAKIEGQPKGTNDGKGAERRRG